MYILNLHSERSNFHLKNLLIEHYLLRLYPEKQLADLKNKSCKNKSSKSIETTISFRGPES
jgi:hypothetical protein